MKSFVRISALLWADILVAYALFVMQNYLTDVWELSLTSAARILNIWGGISLILPVFFQFFVDQLLGNCAMLVISSISYSLGIGFVTMSTPPVLANSTGTCKQYKQKCIGHTQKSLFYTGMALIAVGIAGNLVSLRPFLEEQEKRPDTEVPRIICCVKLPSYTMVVIVPLVGAIALPYIKPWTIRFGIPAICTVVATFLFLTGFCCLPYSTSGPKAEGSPVTSIFRVFAAFLFKISQPVPPDDHLYKKDSESQSFTDTRFLRCLHWAAIIQPGIPQAEQERNNWKLCSVKEVEDAKIAVRMVPMWLTFIICGIVSSIGNTYFVEQGKHMNRHLGKWNVPLPAFLLLFKLAKDQLFGKMAAKLVDTSKKHRPPIGIAVAMVFSILCCITAAKIELKRLHVIKEHGLLDKPKDPIPMSIYWLLFQFFLLAGLDSFLEKSMVAFYKREAPETMKDYFIYFAKGVLGLGSMFSVLSVYVVGKISEKGGKENWFQYTLNKSRLDRYYWVLASLSCVNLIVYMLVATCYSYKKGGNDQVVEQQGDAQVGGVPTNVDDEEKQAWILGLS